MTGRLAALGFAVALVLAAPLAAQTIDPRDRAIAWLREHYAAQERGECLFYSCPVAKGWKLNSLERTNYGVAIAFTNPRPAPEENLREFRALSVAEKEARVRDTLCPYAGFEVWKILPPQDVIRISMSDTRAGLMGQAVCSRRITY